MRKMLSLLLLVLFVFGSCTTMKITNAQFSDSDVATRSLGDFKISVPVTEWFGASGGANLFNISSTAMAEVIEKAIMDEVLARRGDAAIDVTIIYQSSFGNIILNAITAFIYSPSTAIITGKIVEYR
jgi:hypothetical protein